MGVELNSLHEILALPKCTFAYLAIPRNDPAFAVAFVLAFLAVIPQGSASVVACF
jgi:hypothetical protein